MKPILMIFIDGIGIGENDSSKNPFIKYGFKTFEKFFGSVPNLKNQELVLNNNFLFPVDACLGVEGLPQSGTGQTSIFCGFNAAKFVGKHFGPYPYSTLIPLIKEKNIFNSFLLNNKKPFFANAYPKVFFEYIKSGKTRLSVTSLSYMSTGLKLNSSTKVRKGEALTAEITSERWNKKLGYKIPVIKPSTAAKRLLKIAKKNDFTLYEFFLTDHIGHGRIADEFNKIFNSVDEFLFSLFENFDYKNMTLVICSDHGNLEDISVKTHTRNPSLTIIAGLNAEKIKNKIKDISDIKGAILSSC